MSDRSTRLVQALSDGGEGVELMLVTSLVNVRYLTGFTGSNGAALVGPERRLFLTDFRYDEQSAAEVDPSFERRIVSTSIIEELGPLLPDGELRLGFEDHDLTVHQHATLRERLAGTIELVAAGTPVEALRAVKDEEEIARIRAACELADAALREILAQGIVGRTEAEVALALEDAMRRRGASAPSFESIVAAGPHGALPHATPRDVTIDPGQLVVIDWGAVLDGYCSDCTRTVASGEVGEDARIAYDLVLDAQLAGLEQMRPGVGGRDADGAARALIDAAGHSEHFGHGLGHGVGLEVHEKPSLSKRSEDVLEAGNVVSCEPGVYLPGELGVRIEDLCVVTATGREVLTHVPKELLVVD
ncbi:MAG TPA: Xaa-Pro peptidase family protein [Solirubrobacteraceae bacterium]|nr:Xaa-Pro peptidase family protein [Solirubrobacteraceae bacterium]